jgi:multidrug efflux pump subunit AcrA (membrane-fusion protein)
MTRRRVLVPALAAAVVLLLVAGAAWLRFGRAIAVPIVDAAQGRVALRVLGPGTVQARVPVTLSSRITATVARIDIDVGDVVRRGQELVRLDDRDLAARRGVAGGQQVSLARALDAAKAGVAKAEADLELARSKERRDAELLHQGFVSAAVLDASDAALRAARAGLDSARATQAAREADLQAQAQELRYADAQISFTRLTAPMDGVIVARLVEVGSTVVPGSPLLRIVDPVSLWVATQVDESIVGQVRVGQPAHIRLRTGETLAGKVARIARESDAATRELEVDVAFDTPPARFAIDQEAEVTIVAGEAQGIVVPASALTRDRQGRQGLLVVAGSRTAFRPVRTGASDGAQVIVAEGLAAGERVVAPAAGVTAGVRVMARPAAGR